MCPAGMPATAGAEAGNKPCQARNVADANEGAAEGNAQQAGTTHADMYAPAACPSWSTYIALADGEQVLLLQVRMQAPMSQLPGDKCCWRHILQIR